MNHKFHGYQTAGICIPNFWRYTHMTNMFSSDARTGLTNVGRSERKRTGTAEENPGQHDSSVNRAE